MPSWRLLLGSGATVLVACSGNDITLETKGGEVTVGDSTLTLDEDGSASVQLTAEYTGTDGAPISYRIVDPPTLGNLIGTGSQWEYVPHPDANGQDSFTWQATAGEAESDLATVTVFVDPVNDAPRGVGVSLGTVEDTPVSDELAATDVESDPLTWTIVSAPANGQVDLDPSTGEFTYTPDPDFTGTDDFLWSAFDPSGASTGPVRVDLSVADTNDAPTVHADTFVLAEDTSVDGALVADDSDGDPLTWSIVQDVAHGTLTLSATTGAFTYTPWPDYFGSDSFVVVASDGQNDSAPVTIDLVVNGSNDAPEVPPAILQVSEDAVLNAAIAATDVEGDPLTFRIQVPPHNGELTLDPTTGDVTYTPNLNWFGVDEFTVTAEDASLESLPGRFTVVVQAVNDAPTVTGGSLQLTNEDTAVAGAIHGTDTEGDPLAFSIATAPQHGSLTVSDSTGDYVYTPALDYSGSDEFALVASDGQASSALALVTVTVLPINDPPRVTPTTLTVVQDTVSTVALPAMDPEGDTLYFLLQTSPLHGTASLDALTGVLTYTPALGYNGADVVQFNVSDGQQSANGTLPITVTADGDGDDVPDADDNCPDVSNDQRDANGNGIGDACDCWSEPFSATLDPEIWASSTQTAVEPIDYVSPSHAITLLGDGAFLQTLPVTGCPSHQWELQVQLGPPAPEALDALVISARVDGGPWVVVEEIYGTGLEQSFQPLSGLTDGLGLDGSTIEWRIEVVADEMDDLFTIDDFAVSCDTDADWLADCVETFIPGYDLTVADADGDGWLDVDEYLNGADPFLADTDLDAVDDPLDNCPNVYNPGQEDSNANSLGDACDVSYHDDFAAGILDPAVWVGLTGTDGAVTTEYAFSDTFSLRLSGGGAQAEAHPANFVGCGSVAWEFQLKPGPEPPDSTDHFKLEAWNATTNSWEVLLDLAGTSTSNAPWARKLGKTTSPTVLTTGARLRFNVPTTTSGTGYDEWFVDDLTIGCDYDGDMLPSYSEERVHGTDPLRADTDGDGILDGAEILAGTDPLLPN